MKETTLTYNVQITEILHGDYYTQKELDDVIHLRNLELNNLFDDAVITDVKHFEMEVK